MTTIQHESNQPNMSRRRMLMRLGLAATAIYAAPVILQLSDAHASRASGASFSRGGKRARSTDRRRRAGSFSNGRRDRSASRSSRRSRRRGSFSS